MFDCKVYIAFHQKGKVIPKDGCYSALQVGKSISNLQLNIKNDASGENISAKNDIYSELTGWYWIWKNQRHDFVGTGHYRRYFTTSPLSKIRKFGKLLLFFIGQQKKRHGLWYVKNQDKWKNNILSKHEIESIMDEYDIILPQKKIFKYSVSEQYRRRHKNEDIILTRTIINEKYPDYTQTFDDVFNQHKMYSFNMFIMPWDLFESYMIWLFSILFELEKRSDINLADKYQKRVCAFMAERLQTVWIEKNKLKVKELPVLYFKKSKTEHL